MIHGTASLVMSSSMNLLIDNQERISRIGFPQVRVPMIPLGQRVPVMKS